MTSAAHAWLPTTALEPASIASALKVQVEQWFTQWMADAPELTIANGGSDKAAANSELIGGHCLSIRLAPETLQAIGAVCSGFANLNKATHADRSIYSVVGRMALTSLAEQLDTFHDRSQPRLPRRCVRERTDFQLLFGSMDKQWAIEIKACNAAIIGIRRAAARRTANPQSINEVALVDALGHQAIELGARVGSTIVPISAARALAIGDVLLLNTNCADILPLAVNGQPLKRGHCNLRLLDAGLVMEIDQPIHP